MKRPALVHWFSGRRHAACGVRRPRAVALYRDRVTCPKCLAMPTAKFILRERA